MKKTLSRLIIWSGLTTALFLACNENPVGPGPITAGKPAENLQQFEGILEGLRGRLNTPGMSAAIVKNRQIVWAKGFGHANLEKKTAFSYNGNRFGLLDHVIAGASGRTFCELLVERVIKPLELKRTVPNLLSANNCLLTEPERVQFAENLAQGYTSFGQRPKAYDDYFGASAGLISTVNEVAKYSIAIDNNMFLREETKAMVFSPTISANGKALPYGLGWFVQNYRGVKLV